MGKKKRKNKTNIKYEPVLTDHKKKDGKLLPPFLYNHGDTIYKFDWIGDFLPDILFIALLIDEFGEEVAITKALEFVKEAESVITMSKGKSFAFISGFYGIKDTEGGILRRHLEKTELKDDIQRTVFPLVTLYTECPLKILFDENDFEKHKKDLTENLATLKRVVKENTIRRERPATITQATILYLQGMTGKFTAAPGIKFGNLNAVFDYPETEESKKAAASIRALLNSFSYVNREERERWCRYFWKHGYSISCCELPRTPPIPYSQPVKETNQIGDLYELVDKYRNELYKEIEEFWNRLPIDLSFPYKDEVLGGLIARQARLATAIASELNLCSVDIGRILMRCLVDGHITLAWLSKLGETEHFNEFVEYGEGQRKLLAAHLDKIGFKNIPYAALEENEIEDLGTYKQYFDLQPVKPGSWAKKTAREMAREADCLDIYNLAYTRFSASVHGTWNEIIELNLRRCYNPLHRYHRIINLEDPQIFLGIIPASVEIMSQSFDAWARAYNHAGYQSQACNRFREKLIKLFAAWAPGTHNKD